jgi:hypothetical protein
VGFVHRPTIEGSNILRVSFLSSEDGKRSIPETLFSIYIEFQMMNKVQTPSDSEFSNPVLIGTMKVPRTRTRTRTRTRKSNFPFCRSRDFVCISFVTETVSSSVLHA